MENNKSGAWLKAAFIAGAVIDAAAIVPMLVPQFAKIMWGFEGTGGEYWFAMGMGASLMAGWTVLLLWALISLWREDMLRFLRL